MKNAKVDENNVRWNCDWDGWRNGFHQDQFDEAKAELCTFSSFIKQSGTCTERRNCLRTLKIQVSEYDNGPNKSKIHTRLDSSRISAKGKVERNKAVCCGTGKSVLNVRNVILFASIWIELPTTHVHFYRIFLPTLCTVSDPNAAFFFKQN